MSQISAGSISLDSTFKNEYCMRCLKEEYMYRIKYMYNLRPNLPLLSHLKFLCWSAEDGGGGGGGGVASRGSN